MPDAKSADVYTTDEIDAMIGALSIEQDVLTERVSALEGRVTALEGGDPPDPGPGPGPSPEGADLLITVFEPPDLEQGVPAHLSATVENVGTVDVAPGWDAVVGVGFFVDGVQATWASTDVGLPAGGGHHRDRHCPHVRRCVASPPVGRACSHRLRRRPQPDPRMGRHQQRGRRRRHHRGRGTPTGKGGTVPRVELVEHRQRPGGTVRGRRRRVPLEHRVRDQRRFGMVAPDDMVDRVRPDPHHRHPGFVGVARDALTVNMRDDAQPASGTDGHLALMNADGRMFDFWILRPTGERAWRCESWAQHRWDTGTGWGQPPSGPSAGVTAAGAPTAAGTITAAEIDAGVIPHALCMAADYGAQGGVGTCGSGLLPPAIHSDVMGGPGPLAEGALLLAVGDEPGGLNDAERALWRAASTFGVWVIDKLDGSPCFYGDSSATVGNAFRGDKITDIGRRLRMVVTW